jgi:tRNA/tmRNA/rRNA uracil-C5-methylase (TrmA/RlmC/RlmD family)
VRVVEGPERVARTVRGRTFHVRAEGFWQVHPAAAETFVAAVLEALAPRPGERALDLYAGAGLFTAFLAEAVGAEGRVIGLEASPGAVADAGANLADLPQARVRRGAVDAESVARLAGELRGADLVVLDPPRSGVGRAVMEAVLRTEPRAVAYVACDPVAFARDVRVAAELGWRLERVRAFDAFPMTHHIECVGTLLPPDPP